MRTSERNGWPLPGVSNPGVEVSATSVNHEDITSQTVTTPVSLSRRSSISVSDANFRRGGESTSASTPRPSRASSIISTHTKTSIITLDAPQSIDVLLGRENFRIAREGSLIDISRDDTPAPPYDAHFIPAIPQDQLDASETAYQRSTFADDDVQPPATAYNSTFTSRYHREKYSGSLHSIDHRDRDNTSSQLIVFDEQETDSARSPLVEVAGVNRSPSYNPGRESLSVSWRRTSSSSAATEDSSPTTGAKLQRRNGVRLKLVTRTSGEGFGLVSSPLTPGSAVSSSSARSGSTPSAGRTPVRKDHISENNSPIFVGKGAPGLFPTVAQEKADDRNKQLPGINISPENPSKLDDVFVDSVPPPSMDTEDEIRIHYNRLLRTIDRNYRIELHARDEDMSKLRERINEMDQVYRSELRARDQEMEDRLQAGDKELNELRERIRVLERNDQAALDTARNEAEVMWEMVWRGRDRHIADGLQVPE